MHFLLITLAILLCDVKGGKGHQYTRAKRMARS